MGFGSGGALAPAISTLPQAPPPPPEPANQAVLTASDDERKRRAAAGVSQNIVAGALGQTAANTTQKTLLGS